MGWMTAEGGVWKPLCWDQGPSVNSRGLTPEKEGKRKREGRKKEDGPFILCSGR